MEQPYILQLFKHFRQAFHFYQHHEIIAPKAGKLFLFLTIAIYLTGIFFQHLIAFVIGKHLIYIFKIMNIKEKNGISIQFSLCKQFCRIPHKRRLIGYAGCHIRLHHMCQ